MKSLKVAVLLVGLGTGLAFAQGKGNGPNQQASKDSAAPHLKLVSPVKGLSVSGTVTISGTASDNVGVVKVDVFIDKLLLATLTTSPFSLTWNSATMPNGPHTLTLMAYDAAGNVETVTIPFVVNNTTAPGGPSAKDTGQGNAGSPGGKPTPANSGGGQAGAGSGTQPTPGSSSGAASGPGANPGSGSSTPTAPGAGSNTSPAAGSQAATGGTNGGSAASGTKPATGSTAVGSTTLTPGGAAGSGGSTPAGSTKPGDSSTDQSGKKDPDPDERAIRPGTDFEPGQLMVQTRRGVTQAAADRQLLLHGAKTHGKIPQLGVTVIRVPAAAASRVADSLMRSGLFTYVEPDDVGTALATPNDPDFWGQWHLTKIQAPFAWDMSTGSSSQTIAILDSGIDSSHEDLATKLVAGADWVGGAAGTDVFGHGTKVAGSAAAATNNLIGVSGVAWGTRLMPLRIVNSSGYFSYSALASAITYAADHGARVISMSIGGTSSSSTVQSAVNYAWNKGSVLIAAAGNFGNSNPVYPAACNNVVAVGATDSNDNHSGYSNTGNWVDLSAPGDGILTTINGGGYGYASGTSFSAPITAGVVALALAANPSLSPAKATDLLLQNTDDLGNPGYDNTFGWGRVNALRMVTAATGGSNPDSTPPAASISSPGNGATVSGGITIAGTATDNQFVTSIEIYVDSLLLTTLTSSPFSVSWDSRTVSNGSHSITVKAYDGSNNVGQASVGITVNNPVASDTTPPSVTVTSPASGSSVRGNVKLSADARDNVAVSQVTIYVNGAAKCTLYAAPFTCNWNTRKNAAGTYVINARAWDTSGLTTLSADVVVTK